MVVQCLVPITLADLLPHGEILTVVVAGGFMGAGLIEGEKLPKLAFSCKY